MVSISTRHFINENHLFPKIHHLLGSFRLWNASKADQTPGIDDEEVK